MYNIQHGAGYRVNDYIDFSLKNFEYFVCHLIHSVFNLRPKGLVKKRSYFIKELVIE